MRSGSSSPGPSSWYRQVPPCRTWWLFVLFSCDSFSLQLERPHAGHRQQQAVSGKQPILWGILNTRVLPSSFRTLSLHTRFAPALVVHRWWWCHNPKCLISVIIRRKQVSQLYSNFFACEAIPSCTRKRFWAEQPEVFLWEDGEPSCNSVHTDCVIAKQSLREMKLKCTTSLMFKSVVSFKTQRKNIIIDNKIVLRVRQNP